MKTLCEIGSSRTEFRHRLFKLQLRWNGFETRVHGRTNVREIRLVKKDHSIRLFNQVRRFGRDDLYL